MDGGLNTYGYANANSVMFNDPTGEFALKVVREVLKRVRKPTIKPDKKAGVWNYAVVACCNDNIPNNCPEEPSQWCKQAVWRDKNRIIAINVAESTAKKRLGCQPKHVTVRCTGPKDEDYQRGG